MTHGNRREEDAHGVSPHRTVGYGVLADEAAMKSGARLAGRCREGPGISIRRNGFEHFQCLPFRNAQEEPPDMFAEILPSDELLPVLAIADDRPCTALEVPAVRLDARSDCTSIPRELHIQRIDSLRPTPP